MKGERKPGGEQTMVIDQKEPRTDSEGNRFWKEIWKDMEATSEREGVTS